MAEEIAQHDEAPESAPDGDPFSPEKTAEIAAATRTHRPQRHGPDLIKRVTDKAIDLLLDHLRSHAKDKPDSAYTLAELQAEVAAFKATPSPEMETLHVEGWDGCARAVQAMQWEQECEKVLERLMLNSFAHLLPPVGETSVQGKHLSRRIVEPFVQALEQLLGPEKFEQYEKGCQRMVERLQNQQGADFTWEMVLAEPTAQTVVNDVLVNISHHFLSPRKRRRWMIDMVTSTIPPAADTIHKQWQFGDQEFHMLMDALYYGLRNALDSADGKRALTQRYTDATVAQLYSMLQALDRDYLEVMRSESAA
ncbi:MAG: hypothetical protein MJE12_21090 [Alphaproteobacteria bacterium]|nr:hypothetical protein [Alphaproteobacteria bacterium]